MVRAGEVVERLGEQLESEGMLQVLAIPRARMPVVKFEHPATGEQQHGLYNQTRVSIEDRFVKCRVRHCFVGSTLHCLQHLA